MKNKVLIVLLVWNNTILLGQNTSNLRITSRNYSTISSYSSIIIKDSEYYKRLDLIEQQKFEKEVSKLDKAYSNLVDGDYESAAFWANEITKYMEELGCDKNFILRDCLNFNFYSDLALSLSLTNV